MWCWAWEELVGREGFTEARLRILNGSDGPLTHVRAGITLDSETWGPQLFGIIPGRSVLEFTVPIRAVNVQAAEAVARFRDVNELYWERDCFAALSQADADSTEWISAGRAFAERPAGFEDWERGEAVIRDAVSEDWRIA